MSDTGNRDDEPRSERRKRLREERRSHLQLVAPEPDIGFLPRPQPRATLGRLIAKTALLADTASARTPDPRYDDHPELRRSRRGFGWFLP